MRHFNIQNLFTTLCLLLVAGFTLSAQDAADNPPNPEYGKCYAKCRIPDQYETVTEEVMVKEESTRVTTYPAQYETKTEQYLVKEASTQILPVPAVYETASEQVMVKPASVKKMEVPAVYETVTERIMTSPESGKWVQKRDYDCFSSNPDDCTIKCWEKIPAQYKTVTKQVLKTPATTKEIEVPAEYRTVTRQVVKTPATTKVVDIPAEYNTLTKQVLVKPAETKTETIPAEYKTITKTRKVKEGGVTAWQEVLCKSDTSPQMVRDLQNALKGKGFYNGGVDGAMGGQTKAALTRYQEENGLPIGNLNIATLRHLGIYK